ncbi:unnamed protein product [Gongylonema pulchrum]|uniref:KIND domain-containing protein n=1 Tax=Gongylonema pulchrum TaxID=637853 RepID=A0A183ECA5_9BILA|nr:unnamed protein product [Gongylonema pulchrum]
MGGVGVSLSEIIEVRGCGLTDEELLALVIIGCEVLARTPPGLAAAGGVSDSLRMSIGNERELECRVVEFVEVSLQQPVMSKELKALSQISMTES